MSGRRPPQRAIPTTAKKDPDLAPPQAAPVPGLGVVAEGEKPFATPGHGMGPIPPEESGLVHDVPQEEKGEDLSPEEELMFSSLLTCGRRSKTVKILDHTVVVQTLTCDDDLRIGLFAKPFAESVGEQRAYQVAVAAAGLRSIDGKPFVPTLFAEADMDALFDEKCQKVAKMYPHVVQRIYRAVLDAEKEFVSLVDRLGKSTG